MDPRQQRIATIAKWAVGLVGAAIISPIVFLAVKGIAGLILAIVMVVTATQMAPAFGLIIANMAMKLFVSEASRNPIETKKNLRIKMAEALDESRADITAFDTELRNFKGELKSFKANFPDEAESYDQMVAQEEEGLAQMRDQYNEGLTDLDGLDKQIQKDEAVYRMACQALRVANLNKSQKEQVYAKIANDAASRAITSKVNASFAALTQSVNDRKNRKPLMLTSLSATTIPETKATKRAEIVR